MNGPPPPPGWTPAQALGLTGEGLRERKKRLMRQQLSDTATAMFLERGFDGVRVAEVGAACGVSARIRQSAERMRPEKSEVMVLQSDPSLARALLAWESEVELEEGLALTVDWMRENLSSFTPSEYAI